MTFEVEVKGRARAVSIERTDRPGQFSVTVDGERHVVDAARAGEFGLSLLDRPGVPFSGLPGREKVTASLSRDVAVTPGRPGELLITMDGRSTAVTVNGRRTRHTEVGGHGHGDVPIVAPMPGRVVRVLVAVGDEVAARQGLVVVEAMKMENELRAPRAGRVKDVSVAPGTSVEAGRVLAVIE